VPEPEGSSPYSQEPTTGPYSEPTEFLQPVSLIPVWSYSPIYAPVFRVVSFLRAFPPKPCTLFSPVLSHACYMTRPPYPSWFYLSNVIWGWILIIKLLTVQILHYPVTTSFLGPNILLRTLFPSFLSLCPYRNTRDQVSHQYKTTGRIMVLYILTFTFLDSRREDKRL
jgi:hypothetical protein